MCKFVCDCLSLLIVQAKHAVAGNVSWGIDGEAGTIVDMREFGVWEPYSVKAQTYKTAIEVCNRLLTLLDLFL